MREIGAKDPSAVIMVEAALILEAGARDRFDKIIVVTCKPAQKIARLARRTGMSEAQAQAEVDRRSKTQMPDDEKMRRADFVIDNDGTLTQLERKVQDAWVAMNEERPANRVSRS